MADRGGSGVSGISGHPEARVPHSLAPEHDWAAAAAALMPLLQPTGGLGVPIAAHDGSSPRGSPARQGSLPLLDTGPCGLVVAYALPADGFDILVNSEHLYAWGVGAASVRAAALANLAAWSAGVGWGEEESGGRHLLFSDSGEGWDAARILLPDVRRFLAARLGDGGTRVLVGLPDRHLLVAGLLRPDDAAFVELFQDFVLEHRDGADEPVEPRVFELGGTELAVFVP